MKEPDRRGDGERRAAVGAAPLPQHGLGHRVLVGLGHWLGSVGGGPRRRRWALLRRHARRT